MDLGYAARDFGPPRILDSLFLALQTREEKVSQVRPFGY
jgi:hypothetical protein